MPNEVSLLGHRYGKLSVICRDESYNNNNKKWLCRCECGKIISVFHHNLRGGHTKSCGCNKMEHLRGRRKYNTYKHLGDGTTIIYTYRNEEIYIDTEDFNKVNNYCWCVDHVGNAVTNIYNDNGKKTVMRMARYILGVDKGYKVIHLDGCNNNNRKSNLVVIKNITFKSNSNTYIM